MFSNVRFETASTHLVDGGIKVDAEVVGEGDHNVQRVAHNIDSPGSRPHVDGGMAAVEHERIVRLHEHSGIGVVRDLLLHLNASRRDLAARGRTERLSEQLLESLPRDVPQRVFPECVDVLGCKFLAVEDAEEVVQEIAGPCVPGSWIGRKPNNAGL
jgi:hypothetical protein